MSRHAQIFACFSDDWPSVESGFENVDGWHPLGEVPTGAGIETDFWGAVRLQANGGGRARWRDRVDFYAEVLTESPAYAQLKDAATAPPFWLGLHPFGVIDRLYVSSAPVSRVSVYRHFERHPGMIAPPNFKPVGLRLKLAENGTYFEVARA